jgi:hypothetical protein
MIDKMLLMVFSWIMAIYLAVQMLLTGLPLFRRLEYDAICHRYSMKMDQDGGLAADSAAGLFYDLVERGFIVDQISGTENAAFGTEISLYVVVHDRNRRIRSNLTIEEVDISYTYQSSMICRRLKTYAAAPLGP